MKNEELDKLYPILEIEKPSSLLEGAHKIYFLKEGSSAVVKATIYGEDYFLEFKKADSLGL